MMSARQAYVWSIFFISLACLAMHALLNLSGKGLYAGFIFMVLLLLLHDSKLSVVKIIILSLLYANLIITLYNGVFYSGTVIPPIFSAGEAVYESTIERWVSIFGFEMVVRRPTGISDNIHITSLLNLYLTYWLLNNRKYFQSFFVIITILASVNFQIILVLIVWLYFRNSNTKISVVKLLFIVIGIGATFYILDLAFLGGTYLVAIANTLSSHFIYELNYYAELMDPIRILFGIKPGSVDDPQELGIFSIPLTDIGFFGVPIQHGALGIFSIIMLISLWLKLATTQLKVFILVNLLSIVHYFSMISLPAVIVMSWLVRDSIKSKREEKLFLKMHDSDRATRLSKGYK